MDIKSLKRDTGKIEAGEWVPQIPQMGDVRLKVRGMGSEAYGLALNRRIKNVPTNQRDRDGSVGPVAMQKCIAEAAHEALLIDWDGIESDGAEVPYDSDTAFFWLTDPDYVHFRDAVLWAARVVDNGRAAVEGALAKN